MAHIEQKSGSGRRQSNVDLNIVPFIDLMSVLITFLLISAVWTQVSMIQIGSSIYGQKADDQSKPPEQADVVFRLDVKPSGYRVVIASRTEMIPKRDNEYDQASLETYLKEIKKTYPKKEDCIVTVDDTLPYKTLIQGMDALLSAGFPEIAVATIGAE